MTPDEAIGAALAMGALVAVGPSAILAVLWNRFQSRHAPGPKLAKAKKATTTYEAFNGIDYSLHLKASETLRYIEQLQHDLCKQYGWDYEEKYGAKDAEDINNLYLYADDASFTPEQQEALIRRQSLSVDDRLAKLEKHFGPSKTSKQLLAETDEKAYREAQKAKNKVVEAAFAKALRDANF